MREPEPVACLHHTLMLLTPPLNPASFAAGSKEWKAAVLPTADINWFVCVCVCVFARVRCAWRAI